jgi:hypothetical protein
VAAARGTKSQVKCFTFQALIVKKVSMSVPGYLIHGPDFQLPIVITLKIIVRAVHAAVAQPPKQ